MKTLLFLLLPLMAFNQADYDFVTEKLGTATVSAAPLEKQYGTWLYEPIEVLRKQVVVMDDCLLNGYRQDLCDWVMYKIHCYMDTRQTDYNVFYFKGEVYYGDINQVDPGFYPGWRGDTTVVEHRIPTFAGFMQYKLSNVIKIPVSKE